MASYSRRPPRLTVMRVEAAALVLPLPPPPLLLLLLHSAQQVDAFAVLSEAVTLYEAERLVEIDTRAARGGS